jgi:glutathione S-transferase
VSGPCAHFRAVEAIVKPLTLFRGVRFVLALKKLAYQTVWVNFRDIEAKAKEVGAPPSKTNADGSDGYTVPFIVIQTPSSSKPVVLSDSLKIIKYLDEAFPDPSLTLFPPDTRVLDAVFSRYFLEKVGMPIVYYITPANVSMLPSDSQQHFKDTRMKTMGIAYEVLAPGDPAERAKLRKGFEDAFDGLATLLDAGGEGNFRINDGRVTFAEIDYAAMLWLVRGSSGNEDGAWTILKERNEGRWAKLLDLPEYDILNTF